MKGTVKYNAHKFSLREINAIVDCLDKYGFLGIYYLPCDDVFYVIFDRVSDVDKNSKDLYAELYKHISDIKWKCIDNSTFMDRALSRQAITCMMYSGFNREVCEDDYTLCFKED